MIKIEKIAPQFPVLVQSEGDTMIYVFLQMDMPRKTYWDFYAKGAYNDAVFIDSTGRIFKAINTKLVKFGIFGGYNLHFRKGSRTIWIDFEWKQEEGGVPLNELKTKLKQMAGQESEIWEEKFGDMQELYSQVEKTENYEELFRLFR